MLVGEMLLFVCGVLVTLLVGVVVFRERLVELTESIIIGGIILFFIVGALVISVVCNRLIEFGGVGFFLVPIIFVGGIVLIALIVDDVLDLVREDGGA